MKVGALLKETRKKKGLSTVEVCDMVGIYRPQLSDYENSQMVPSKLSIINKLANVLGLDERYIEALGAVESGRIPAYLMEDTAFMEMLDKRIQGDFGER